MKHTIILLLITALVLAGTITTASAAETGEEWDPVQPHSGEWSARHAHGVVSHDGYLWVMGGYTGSRQNDVWKSADGVSWTQVTASAGWSARYAHGVVSHDGYLWVMGGIADSNLNDVWKSADGVSWIQVTASAGWSARQAHGAVSHGNWIYVLGGLNSVNLADTWRTPLAAPPTLTPTSTPGPTATPAPGSPGTYFTASPRFGTAPLNVTFTDRSTGSPSSWLWEYRISGETTWDEMSTSQHPLISLPSDGRYDIRLNATNEYGSTIYTRTGYIRVGEGSGGLSWDPELGIWTKDWFDTSASIPDPFSLWSGITAPIVAILGSLFYVWIWLVLVAGSWLYTGETTTPYVIGLISGSALAGTAQLVGQDGGIMMMIVMGFAGAGVLAKVIAGRG